MCVLAVCTVRRARRRRVSRDWGSFSVGIIRLFDTSTPVAGRRVVSAANLLTWGVVGTEMPYPAGTLVGSFAPTAGVAHLRMVLILIPKLGVVAI